MKLSHPVLYTFNFNIFLKKSSLSEPEDIFMVWNKDERNVMSNEEWPETQPPG